MAGRGRRPQMKARVFVVTFNGFYGLRHFWKKRANGRSGGRDAEQGMCCSLQIPLVRIGVTQTL